MSVPGTIRALLEEYLNTDESGYYRLEEALLNRVEREREDAVEQLWLKEFINPDQHCGLCGQSGVVNTMGQVWTAAGYHAGTIAFCICPNGRSLAGRGAKPADVLAHRKTHGQNR